MADNIYEKSTVWLTSVGLTQARLNDFKFAIWHGRSCILLELRTSHSEYVYYCGYTWELNIPVY